MQHRCRVTVIDRKLYPEFQARYCADPRSGPCPCYRVGDMVLFECCGQSDGFWHMGLGLCRGPARRTPALSSGSTWAGRSLRRSCGPFSVLKME